MKMISAIPGCLLALSMTAFSTGVLADGKLALVCGEIRYEVSVAGKGSACARESGDENAPVLCSDNEGEAAKASCANGCEKTARTGTCTRVDPPPPPPPATTTTE